MFYIFTEPLFVRSIDKFKLKLAASSGSGQTSPPNSTQEDLISQVLALDDSLRLNVPRVVDHSAPVNAVRTAPPLPAARCNRETL